VTAITAIAKSDVASDAVLRLWQGVLAQIASHMQACQAHPARVVVLVPYAQLMPVAQRIWAQSFPDGFAPRFETTRNWAARLAPWQPAGDDLSGELARDLLAAQLMLDRAGLSAQRDSLAPLLLEAVQQMGAVVAAVSPAQRAHWGEHARSLLQIAHADSPLQYEALVARIAMEWALASRYPTDVLWDSSVQSSVDALVVLEGFQPDPWAQVLQARQGQAALVLSLAQPLAQTGFVPNAHVCADGEDEALHAAACVLALLQQGRAPVALVATDRALTRRIQAHLHSKGVQMRDESGWTLSTTRSAAQVMATLKAAAWSASADDVLDWLKHSPAVPMAACNALERALRTAGLPTWERVLAWVAQQKPVIDVPAIDAQALIAQAEAWRQSLQTGRSLPDWLAALRQALVDTEQWPALLADPAGTAVLGALRLQDVLHADVHQWQGAGRRMSLSDFTRWAKDVLEAARYTPDAPAHAAVVVLPMSQLLARPFAAVVLPGCDEKRLPASPEPPGAWSRAQREAWGLPQRETLAAAQWAAWRNALSAPYVDLLWRTGDEGGEPLLPSPLVLALQLQAQQAGTPWPMPEVLHTRSIPASPTQPPQPTGQALPVRRLSSSAYADLRHCPYRFFALRQLGLQEMDELDGELSKRDFGTWLHAVLQGFHMNVLERPAHTESERVQRMDEAAQAASQALGLDESDFLPFAASWPVLRDGYLHWLAKHETQGAGFEQAELSATQPLDSLELVGTIDRIDRLPAAAPGAPGAVMVIDYKTENIQRTRQRIKDDTEDTQLAFYAALLHHDNLRAAYVNVGERGDTASVEQPDIVALRDALLEGIQHDFAQIAAGAPMPALGEGSVCEHCAARGLCRKDFWA
jgi:ATP-dependent helicase/nuclease subunit B